MRTTNAATRCLNLGEYARAAADYRRALALRPSDAVLLNNLGMALLCSGEFEAALRRLDEAVAACARITGTPTTTGDWPARSWGTWRGP